MLRDKEYKDRPPGATTGVRIEPTNVNSSLFERDSGLLSTRGQSSSLLVSMPGADFAILTRKFLELWTKAIFPTEETMSERMSRMEPIS